MFVLLLFFDDLLDDTLAFPPHVNFWKIMRLLSLDKCSTTVEEIFLKSERLELRCSMWSLGDKECADRRIHVCFTKWSGVLAGAGHPESKLDNC